MAAARVSIAVVGTAGHQQRITESGHGLDVGRDRRNDEMPEHYLICVAGEPKGCIVLSYALGTGQE